MLIEQSYALDKKENLPIITLPWFNKCRAIIDTGATLPMWLKKDTILKLKGATKENIKVDINGVGGKTAGALYRVNFDIGNIHFKHMPIIYKKVEVADAYMILPFSMFDGMKIEFDNIKHIFKIQVNSKEHYRELQIKDEQGRLYAYLAQVYATEEEYNKHKSQQYLNIENPL